MVLFNWVIVIVRAGLPVKRGVPLSQSHVGLWDVANIGRQGTEDGVGHEGGGAECERCGQGLSALGDGHGLGAWELGAESDCSDIGVGDGLDGRAVSGGGS